MKKVKVTTYILLLAFMFSLLNDSQVLANDITSENQPVLTRTILVINKTVTTESKRIDIEADVHIQDSYNQIIGLSNIKITGWDTSCTSISTSPPQIWDRGDYATVTVTYLYNRKLVSEICYFYP